MARMWALYTVEHGCCASNFQERVSIYNQTPRGKKFLGKPTKEDFCQLLGLTETAFHAVFQVFRPVEITVQLSPGVYGNASF